VLSNKEILRSLLWVFLALFGIQALIAYLLAGQNHVPDPLVVALAEAFALTMLFAGASISWIGRPVRQWLQREQLRVEVREEHLRKAAGRQEFRARLAQALNHAVDEEEAKWVLQRAIDQVSPTGPVELILSETEGQTLQRVVTGGGTDNEFGCPVVAGGICPAIRSGQVRESDTDDLGACRMLVEKNGTCHGLCIPVTINGRARGVLHTARDSAPNDEIRTRLKVIAEQAGIRLGLFRVMAASERAASTDELTGLLNRRAFTEQAEKLFSTGRPLGLVIADIDHFKRLNDTYGHQIGDRALRAFAKVITSCARPTDVTARLGGEEFVFLLPEADSAGAQSLVSRIQQLLPEVLSSQGLPAFTLSYGIADLRHGQCVADLIHAADQALYHAKANGRNRVVVCDVSASVPIRSIPGGRRS